jgi:cysteine-rich repeat protein
LNGFNVTRGECVERCGKGFRIFVQCDDGNNITGDGCSSNCTIENGWTCSGGSPNTPDRCTYLTPVAVTLNSTGQVHTFSNIYANVRINYLPTNLSQNNCSRCNDNILLVNLTSRPLTQPRITTSYIRGSSYTFSVRFEFPSEPISEFSATVQINPSLAQTYFQGVDVSQVITLNVNPAVMALQDNVGELSLP